MILINETKTKKKKGGITDAFRQSVILYGIIRFANYLYKLAAGGLIGTMLTDGYKHIRDKYESSFIGGILSTVGKSRLSDALRHTVIRVFDRSVIIERFRYFFASLTGVALKNYAVFFLSFGLTSAAVFGVKEYIIGVTPELTDLICSLFPILLSLPLFFSDTYLAKAFSESVFADIFFFKMLEIKKEPFEKIEAKNSKYYTALLLGNFLGIVTFEFNPIIVLLIPAALIFVYIIMATPEIGVTMMIGFIPFLPTMVLVGLSLLTFISYFFKLIRCKRSFRPEFSDFPVIMFTVMMLFGGIVSMNVSESLKAAAVFVAFLLGYFLVVNLMRTTEWVMRCLRVLLISASVVSLIGLAQYLTGNAATTWQDSEMFSDISGRVVSTLENPNVLAEYLIMIMPFAGALMVTHEKISHRFRAFVCFALCFACLILTWSRGAWLGILFGGLLLLLIYSRKTLLFLFAGVAFIPFAPFVLPASIVSRFTSIGNLGDSSTSYRVGIWHGVWKMLGKIYGSGIGIGTGAFERVYPFYAYSGIEVAPHSHNLFTQIVTEIGLVGLVIFLLGILLYMQSCYGFFAGKDALLWHDAKSEKKIKLLCAAGMCGILAVLVQGLTDYIWYNYRVFLAFWLILGLTNALRRSSFNGLVAHKKGYETI